jgi:hypothetical protein
MCLDSAAGAEANSDCSVAFATSIGGKHNAGRLVAPSLRRQVLISILPQAHIREDLRSSGIALPAS